MLADKITMLRKKQGWSQEELAERLDVTRQSVSKWESGQSIPDISKIVKMSQLFNVTIDFLLMEDTNQEPVIEQTIPPQEVFLQQLSMEDAKAFLQIKKANAKRISLGVLLCVLSPVCLIGLAGINEFLGTLSENAAAGIGLLVLLAFVAAGCVLFVSSGMNSSKFRHLEEEPFSAPLEVTRMVQDYREDFRSTYAKGNLVGLIFCICAVAPIFLALIWEENQLIMLFAVCILFILAGIGAASFVLVGVPWSGIQTLLQEGEYSVPEKNARKKIGGIYWPAVTAIYLAYSFLTMNWGSSWIIWPVAGVLYGAICAVYGKKAS